MDKLGPREEQDSSEVAEVDCDHQHWKLDWFLTHLLTYMFLIPGVERDWILLALGVQQSHCSESIPQLPTLC